MQGGVVLPYTGLTGVYSFLGHPKVQALSQFLKNEAAGGTTTSQGTQEVRH